MRSLLPRPAPVWCRTFAPPFACLRALKERVPLGLGLLSLLSGALLLPPYSSARGPAPEEPPGSARHTVPSPTVTMADVAFDGEHVWVAGWDEARLFRVDLEDGRVLKEMEAPCFHPHGLAWHDGRLFVSDPYEAMVYRLNVRSGEVEASFPTPETTPLGLAHDGDALWLADTSVHQLYRLNPDDGTILDYLQAPSLHSDALAYDGTYLWVGDRLQDALYRVDPGTGYVVDILSSPDRYPVGLAWGDSELLAADFESGLLYRLAPPGGAPYTVNDWRDSELRFVHRVRNDGPGVVTRVEINIAVPPESLENQVLMSEPEFRPAPKRRQDRWGQEIASYVFQDLVPGEEVEAGYTVRFRVADLAYHIVPEEAGTLEEIPREIAREYLVDEDRYLIGDAVITGVVAEVVGEEENTYWIARRLFQWVLDHLEYMRVGGWDTPPTLIKRESGSCSEYAFLYISLCRAAGLPARYEAGTALRGDEASIDDVYHRWVEVYLPRYGWVPVDPSRGDKGLPSEQAQAIGTASNRLFITTIGGGASEDLSWYYNSFSRVRFRGKAKVTETAYSYWRRAEEEGEPPVASSAAVRLDEGAP